MVITSYNPIMAMKISSVLNIQQKNVSTLSRYQFEDSKLKELKP